MSRPEPAGRHPRRRRRERRHRLHRRRGDRVLPVRRRPARSAAPRSPSAPATCGTRTSPASASGARYGLRAHGPWEPQRGAPLQSGETADRPARASRSTGFAGSTRRCSAIAPTDPDAPDGDRQRARSCRARRGRRRGTIRSRAAAGHALAGHRSSTNCMSAASPCAIPPCRSRSRGTFAGLGPPGRGRASGRARRHRRRTAARRRLGRGAASEAARAAPITGATTRSPSARPTRAWPRAAGRRCGRPSRRWPRPASRRSWTWCSTTPAKATRSAPPCRCAAWTTRCITGCATAARYVDDTGCGNTLALDRPHGVRLAMDALRAWAQLGGVHGFRFDLATTLGRRAGRVRPGRPAADRDSQDPVLRRLKLIAEPWDVGPGGYQLGAFPGAWGEWNDQFPRRRAPLLARRRDAWGRSRPGWPARPTVVGSHRRAVAQRQLRHRA